MALSDNIQRLRIERGMTQGEIAQRIGITAMAVSLYEQNRRKPEPETLVALAECLGTTVEKLVKGDGENGLKTG